MWPEIADAFRGSGLRLVVTYGWEGLRTWDSGPAWQERCDQVEAEVKGRFAGHDVIFTGRLSKPDLARVQCSPCLPLSLQLLRDVLPDRARMSGGGRAGCDVGVWGVGDYVGGWRRA